MSIRTPLHIELQVLEMYKEKVSPTEIGKIFNISRTTVVKIAQRHGFHRSHRESKRKYTFNEGYFETIDTEDKSYWLGFIAADGSVHRNSGNTFLLTIGLSRADKAHLKNFSKAVGYTGGVNNTINTFRGKDYESCKIHLSSSKMARDLGKYGIVPNKTYTKCLDTTLIPDHLVNHYIRGFFDGDGSVFWGNLTKNTPQRTVSFSSNYENLHYLQELLISEVNINRNKIVPDNRSDYTFSLRYKGNRQVDRLYKWMYNGASICLDRKKDVFLSPPNTL